MSNEEIKYLGDVQRLVLQPGDILVLKMPHAISAEMAERQRGSLRAVLGEDRKILILDPGTDIGVLSRHQAA